MHIKKRFILYQLFSSLNDGISAVLSYAPALSVWETKCHEKGRKEILGISGLAAGECFHGCQSCR